MISKTEVGSCPHVNLRVAIVCVNQFCLLNRYLGVALETLSFFSGTIAGFGTARQNLYLQYGVKNHFIQYSQCKV